MPSRRERRDAAAAVTADRARRRLLSDHKVMLLGHHRPYFLDDKIGIIRAHCVVLKRPVAARLITRLSTRHTARVYKQPDRHRQFLPMNEIIKNNRNPRVTVLAYKPATILKHHQVCRLLRIVLGRNIHPIRACRAGERLAVIPSPLNDLPLRHPFLPLGIRPGTIIGRSQKAAVE